MARKVAIVAGEASGDILGAGLIHALKRRAPDLEFIGVGGPRMIDAGLTSLFDMDRLSVMGFTDVLARLPELLRRRRDLIRHILEQEAGLYIGIDSPDFNLPIAGRLHRRGLRTVHYVSPSVWAWRQGRIHGIRRNIDLMLTLLPFEAGFYEEHGVPVAFVGHPLADDIPLEDQRDAARAELGIADDAQVVAVLPGSRGGEIRHNWPVFNDTIALLRARRPALRFLVPAAGPVRHAELSAQLAHNDNVTLLEGRSHQAMAAADVVLLASGTATLEATLLKRPMVVGYRVSDLTYRLFRRLLKTPYVSLPNLLGKGELVPELLQHDMTPGALADAVERWLDDEAGRAALQARFHELHVQLRRGASERAAAAVAELLR